MPNEQPPMKMDARALALVGARVVMRSLLAEYPELRDELTPPAEASETTGPRRRVYRRKAAAPATTPTPKKRRKKTLAERKAISARMKTLWKARRAAEAKAAKA